MKLTTPFLAGAMLASSVQACIRLHVVARYNPLVGDGIRVQIWDNNDFYEVQSQSRSWSNSETRWQFSFGGGHFVELTRNGKVGFVSMAGGYHADFHSRLEDYDEHCYVMGDNLCRISGSMWETALDDNFGNCNQYGHQLCNESDCPR